MKKEIKQQIGRLEKCKKTWEEKAYCDENGLCEFCQKQVLRIDNYINQLKRKGGGKQ